MALFRREFGSISNSRIRHSRSAISDIQSLEYPTQSIYFAVLLHHASEPTVSNAIQAPLGVVSVKAPLEGIRQRFYDPPLPVTYAIILEFLLGYSARRGIHRTVPYRSGYW
ncbi:hypothetical protein PSENEW3_00004265 [Picochlorum sp. SENEW3]|nr:hypothetical protein PSENEW3_00004265 [Picochlorum sp. SENEW3]